MKRLASILCLIIVALSMCSCESMWLDAYRHQGGGYSTKENLQWMRTHYLDAPLTKALNTHSATLKVAFHQPLLVPIKYHGKELYQNVQDWTVTVNGHDFIVKAGRVVNGASVPRAFWCFMPPDGLHRAAALFHDEGYTLQGHFPDGTIMTKDELDDAFYNLMVEAGVSKPRAKIGYEGVHLFGQPAWDSIEEPLILPLPPMGLSQAPERKRTIFSHIFAP